MKMFNIRSIFTLFFVVIIAACSDGDSSSNDSSSGGDAQPSVTYSGTQNLILSTNDVSETTEIDAKVTITGDQIVIDPLSATGSIVDDNYVAISNRVSEYNGLSCQFLLTYTGSLSGDTLSGSISGTAKCEGEDSSTQDVIGTVTASRD